MAKKTVKKGYKNYVYALLIILGFIGLTLYGFSWYRVKKEERLMRSYLLVTNTIESNINDLDSIDQILDESPSSYFIYISYNNSEEVYNFEKSLKRIIDKYRLNDIFYYINATELMDSNEDYLNVIKDKFKIKDINRLPIIIYVNEHKITEDNILSSKNNSIIDADDFEKLLINNEFESLK